MKTLRKTIPIFVPGVGVGSLTECLFSLIYGQAFAGAPVFMVSHPSPVFVKITQTLLYGGFGLASLLREQFFLKKNNKSFLRATAIHFLLIFAYFAFIGFYLHWFPNAPSVSISLDIFIPIYFVIWILIYLAEKRKIEEMNRVLERNHNHLVDE